jgi:hypothetical protein
MQRYKFQLQDGKCPVEDESVWLSGHERARDHAEAVAGELMRGRERQTRSWCLEVYENGELIFAVPFASVDPTLDHLAPPLRRTIEASNESIRSMHRLVSAAHATVRESRALVAKSRGKPYLAAERGEPTIRNEPARAAGREPPEGGGAPGARVRRIK